MYKSRTAATDSDHFAEFSSLMFQVQIFGIGEECLAILVRHRKDTHDFTGSRHGQRPKPQRVNETEDG